MRRAAGKVHNLRTPHSPRIGGTHPRTRIHRLHNSAATAAVMTRHPPAVTTSALLLVLGRGLHSSTFQLNLSRV